MATENTGSEHQPFATQPDHGERGRNDADFVGQKLDRLLSHLDSVHARLDALETRTRSDVETGGSTGVKKVNVEDPDGDGVPGDGRVTTPDSRKDEGGKIERRGITAEVAADAEDERADAAAKAEVQARADSIYMGLGQRAAAPMSGETLTAYRRRLARPLQRHSKAFGDVDLASVGGKALDKIEEVIYNDAYAAARTGEAFKGPGALREIVKVDPSTGARMISFHGDHTFIRDMNRTGRRVTAINTKFPE